MKNIAIRTVADDLTFLTSVLNKATGEKKKILIAQQLAIENALTTYTSNINYNVVAPLGLKKGQKAAKAVKEVKDSSGVVIIKATPRKIAKKDAHEHYYELYDSKSKTIASKKKQLNDDPFGHICPYCGVDTVATIDHYLPRSDFPEFSISLQNLLMSCYFCNTTYKRTNWGNAAGKHVINPFLDQLPAVEFLTATCTYSNQAISTNFSIVQGLPLSDLLERHFVLMNLNDRYKAKATLIETKAIKTKLESVTGNYRKTKALTSFVDDKILVNPPNSWQHAYYVGIKNLIPQIVTGGL